MPAAKQCYPKRGSAKPIAARQTPDYACTLDGRTIELESDYDVQEMSGADADG